MNNYHWIKRIFIIIITFAIIYTFFTNVLSSQKLDNLAYVVAIGIDEGEIEEYKLTFQVSTVKSSSSNSAESSDSQSSSSSGSSGTPSYVTHTVECNSIDMGISLMNTYINKQLNLSHCKIIILSDSLAQKGIRSIIYNFVNKIEIRPDCNVIVSTIPDKEFENNKKPSMEELLPKFFDLTTNTEEEESEYTQNVTLGEFYAALEDPLSQPFCSLGVINNAKNSVSIEDENSVGIDKTSNTIKSKDEDILIELLGISVFNDDKMIGKLSGIETLCHFMLTDNLKQGIVSVPNPFDANDNLNIYISMVRSPKIKVYIDHRRISLRQGGSKSHRKIIII